MNVSLSLATIQTTTVRPLKNCRVRLVQLPPTMSVVAAISPSLHVHPSMQDVRCAPPGSITNVCVMTCDTACDCHGCNYPTVCDRRCSCWQHQGRSGEVRIRECFEELSQETEQESSRDERLRSREIENAQGDEMGEMSVSVTTVGKCLEAAVETKAMAMRCW